jgi:hypothetical protein
MIAVFIAEKMIRYIAGGMSAETAAHFTCVELAAIYKGDHRSRDSAGQWRATPQPEALDIEDFRKLKELTESQDKFYSFAKYVIKKAPQTHEKGPILSAEPKRIETHGIAPETVPQAQETPSGAKQNGLEGLKNYIERKSA